MSGPFILARSAGLPDAGFPGLDDLARALVDLRDAHPKATDMVGITANVARSAQPSGVCVAVRLDDAKDGRASHGTFLAYAFMPYGEESARDQASRLMQAIDAAAAAKLAGRVAA